MKRGKHVGESTTTPLVYARSGGDCEVRIPGFCQGRATNRHHRQNRSQGGRWSPEQILHCCGSGSTGCHGALTNTNGRRAEYEANGWIVRSHLNPADVEVLMWHDNRQDWFLLREDGTAVLAEFPSGDPRHPDDIERPQEPRDLDGVA